MPNADVVSFSRGLYPPEAVRAAVEAYAALGTFRIEEGEHDVRVHVEKADADVADVLLDEFCNHVLYETVVRTVAADAEQAVPPA